MGWPEYSEHGGGHSGAGRRQLSLCPCSTVSLNFLVHLRSSPRVSMLICGNAKVVLHRVRHCCRYRALDLAREREAPRTAPFKDPSDVTCVVGQPGLSHAPVHCASSNQYQGEGPWSALVGRDDGGRPVALRADRKSVV